MHAAVASGVDGNAMSAETRLGTLDRLPEDVLTIIVAQLHGRQMEDVNVWQARRDLRRRARINVSSRAFAEWYTWDELTPDEQSAAISLGWDATGESWDYGGMPPAVMQPWAVLSPNEFMAAWTLGYSPSNWHGRAHWYE